MTGVATASVIQTLFETAETRTCNLYIYKMDDNRMAVSKEVLSGWFPSFKKMKGMVHRFVIDRGVAKGGGGKP